MEEKLLYVSKVVAEMLDKYGEDKQVDICIEEMSELTKELLKNRRGSLNQKQILEEMSDVTISLLYLMSIYNIRTKDIFEIMYKKALRTEERYLKDDE